MTDKTEDLKMPDVIWVSKMYPCRGAPETFLTGTANNLYDDGTKYTRADKPPIDVEEIKKKWCVDTYGHEEDMYSCPWADTVLFKWLEDNGHLTPAIPQDGMSFKDAATIMALFAERKYIAGIVERGENRTISEDESLPDAVLNYVKKLEKGGK